MASANKIELANLHPAFRETTYEMKASNL